MKLWRLGLKTLLLFALCNGLYAVLNPLPSLQKISIYNHVVDGRSRLPYSRNPSADYSLPLLQIDGLLATHEISQAKDEFRVLLLGDSSVWGWQLHASETLSACLNALSDWRFYNLGYPLLNVTKDWLILEAALKFDPDWVIWFITLESLYPEKQQERKIVQANLNPRPQTLIGQRKALADWLRLQVYGIPWHFTGIDHRDKAFFAPVRQNLQDNSALLEVDRAEPWQPSDLALDVLAAGIQAAEGRVLLVNEPIYISPNSEHRYNFYYPRWAYDSYRSVMQDQATEQGWHYADFWDAMPPEAFSDSSFHLNAAASCEFAAKLAEVLDDYP